MFTIIIVSSTVILSMIGTVKLMACFAKDIPFHHTFDELWFDQIMKI